MPRYHFHVQDGQFIPDVEGEELPDLAAAKEMAVEAFGEMVKGLKNTFWQQGTPWHMRVTDSDERLLFTMTLSADVVPPRGAFLGKPE